jgi:glycosyltransferase involved in cell wall biosynthesis
MPQNGQPVNKPFKLLLISHGFPPQSHSGVFRASSFAKYLPQFGIDVVVLTAKEPLQSLLHYPQQRGPDTEVVRVRFGEDHQWLAPIDRMAFRIPGLSGLAKNRQLLRKARRAWQQANTVRDFADVDGVLATSPPPIAAVLGWYAARSLNVPFWCDLRDPWTYQMGVRYRTRLDLIIEAGLENRVLSDATMIVTNTETAREDLTRDFGLPIEKVEVVPNGFDESKCRLAEQKLGISADRQSFDVVYVGLGSYSEAAPRSIRGAIKRFLGIDITPVELDYNTRSPLYILSALGDATARSALLRDRLRFRWLGPIDGPTKSLLTSHERLFAIDAPGAVDEQTSVDAIFAADLLVLLQAEMRRRSIERCTAIPAKTFVYLRSGRPILAALQSGELAELLSRFPGCKVVPSREPRLMADVVLDCFEEWSRSDVRTGIVWPRSGIEMFERQNIAERLSRLVKPQGTAEYARRACG